MGEAIRPGVTALELDAIAEEVIRGRGGIPSFIGVPGPLAPFAHTVCVSVDDEVVHGVPDERVIREGQLVSVDCGAIVDGWHGDSARTWLVGDVSEEARRLSMATREAMLAGVAASVPGNILEDVAGAIEDVGLAHGYGIVRAYVGHGIGNEMHEEPQVTNYRTGRRVAASSPGCASPSSRCSRSAATRCASRRTAGPWPRPMAAWRLTGSTPSPSPRTVRAS